MIDWPPRNHLFLPAILSIVFSEELFLQTKRHREEHRWTGFSEKSQATGKIERERGLGETRNEPSKEIAKNKSPLHFPTFSIKLFSHFVSCKFSARKLPPHGKKSTDKVPKMKFSSKNINKDFSFLLTKIRVK